MIIEVMGIDGEKTAALERAVREALAGLAPAGPVDVRRVADPAAIIARGARRWPALRVDGRLLCSGSTPPAGQVCAWLEAALAAEA